MIRFTVTYDRTNFQRVQLKLKNMSPQILEGIDEVSRDLMNRAKVMAQEEITMKAPGGSGMLANSLRVIRTKGKKNEVTYTLRPIGLPSTYATYVERGFRPHWVRISSNPRLVQWIYRNLPSDRADRLIDINHMYVGGKNSAQWIKEGGMRFMYKAMGNVRQMARTEFNKKINEILNKR